MTSTPTKGPPGPTALVINAIKAPDCPLNAPARLTAIIIAAAMGRDTVGDGRPLWSTFLSQETLATRTGLSRRSIQRAIADLKVGWSGGVGQREAPADPLVLFRVNHGGEVRGYHTRTLIFDVREPQRAEPEDSQYGALEDSQYGA
jgi:Helix-turn-helix domain